MDIKSIEFCIVVTVFAFIGLIVNGYALLQGVHNGFVSWTQIITCIFNIFALSSLKPIRNICGFYKGEKRYLILRRYISYGLWGITLLALVLTRQDKLELSTAFSMMNFAGAFTILNVYGFGKSRGIFSLCKYH